MVPRTVLRPSAHAFELAALQWALIHACYVARHTMHGASFLNMRRLRF